MWVTGCEWLPQIAVAALIRDGRAAGLAVLVGAGSPAAATEVADWPAWPAPCSSTGSPTVPWPWPSGWP